jgi:hypothetical protein
MSELSKRRVLFPVLSRFQLSLVFADAVDDLSWIRQTFGSDFHAVLTRTGKPDSADSEQSLNKRLVELDVADVIMLHFRCLASDDAFLIDRSVVHDGQRCKLAQQHPRADNAGYYYTERGRQ